MDETKYGFWFPPDVSTHGVQIDQLIDIVHWLMLVLFVGWGVFFVYCLIKYRARPGHAARYVPVKAVFTKYIETAVIVVELLLLFGFSTPVWFKYKNKPPPERDALVVKMVAEQFAWNFHYAGKDGKFGKSSEEISFASSASLIMSVLASKLNPPATQQGPGGIPARKVYDCTFLAVPP